MLSAFLALSEGHDAARRRIWRRCTQRPGVRRRRPSRLGGRSPVADPAGAARASSCGPWPSNASPRTTTSCSTAPASAASAHPSCAGDRPLTAASARGARWPAASRERTATLPTDGSPAMVPAGLRRVGRGGTDLRSGLDPPADAVSRATASRRPAPCWPRSWAAWPLAPPSPVRRATGSTRRAAMRLYAASRSRSRSSRCWCRSPGAATPLLRVAYADARRRSRLPGAAPAGQRGVHRRAGGGDGRDLPGDRPLVRPRRRRGDPATPARCTPPTPSARRSARCWPASSCCPRSACE